MRRILSVAAVVLATGFNMGNTVHADEVSDPLASSLWGDISKQLFAGQQVRFDSRVLVAAPVTAENPLQVPVTVDATALSDVREVLVFADYNPILRVLRFYPEKATPYLGFRLKLQQSSPIRAAARTGDGVWHVGGTWVNTVGGGCTVPSVAAASPEWQQRLNEVSGRQWSEGPNAGRVRFRVVHPMDTGLVAGTPAFHLEEVTLSEENGQRLMRVLVDEPVSENPVFTLQRKEGSGPVVAVGRDNNGNRFQSRIAP